MQTDFAALRPKVEAALDILGISNFLLGIHDAAFPGLPEEDLGRGSPYSRGAAEFLKFVRTLGFTGVQFGPQGMTTAVNPSPYDGTFFSKNPLSLAPLMLTEEPWNLLAPEKLAALTACCPERKGRIREIRARAAIQTIAGEIFQRYRHRQRREKAVSLHSSLKEFRQRNASWLERDALYEILRQEYGGKNWREWKDGENARLDRHLFCLPPALEAAGRQRISVLLSRHQQAIESYCLIQYLLAEQHNELRSYCRLLGLRLFGDCQIGLSGRDSWYAQSFILPGYVLGAPPSRTNPEGQPWNYPVPDPRLYTVQDRSGYRRPGPVADFLRDRVDKLFTEFDGLRIDHPHGLVCPWVYRTGQADPVRAVQQGARLFASPALADHPELAEFTIVRQDQLNEGVQRHDDNWVAALEPEQVRRYALLFEVIMESARRNCRGACEIACEILSTQPYPIRRVMEFYGLGRFRVTQKADLDNPSDVYRSENAGPADWLMLGNHDTPTVWQKADEWCAAGVARQQAVYLAERLRIPAEKRAEWAERTGVDAGALVQAKFADLFIGPAKNIMVFFTDLLGGKEAYNRPGTVSADNWSLRIDPDYLRSYSGKLLHDLALNIPKALAMALKAKGYASGSKYRQLITDLENFPTAGRI